MEEKGPPIDNQGEISLKELQLAIEEYFPLKKNNPDFQSAIDELKNGNPDLMMPFIQAEIESIGDVTKRTTQEYRESGAITKMVLHGWLYQLKNHKFF